MTEPSVRKPRSRRRRGLVAAGLVLVALVLFHAPLLRATAGFLVVDARLVDARLNGECELVPAVNSAESFDHTAALFAAGRESGLAMRVVVVPNYPRRSDTLGITVPNDVDVLEQLVRRGVERSRLASIGRPADDLYERLEQVVVYVKQNPTRRVMLVVPRYEGRVIRRRVESLLDVEARGRVGYASFEPELFDERRWWMTRSAVQQVFQGYVTLIASTWFGLPERRHRPFDLQAYEARLAAGAVP